MLALIKELNSKLWIKTYYLMHKPTREKLGPLLRPPNCENFVEMHSFCEVSGYSPETLS